MATWKFRLNSRTVDCTLWVHHSPPCKFPSILAETGIWYLPLKIYFPNPTSDDFWNFVRRPRTWHPLLILHTEYTVFHVSKSDCFQDNYKWLLLHFYHSPSFCSIKSPQNTKSRDASSSARAATAAAAVTAGAGTAPRGSFTAITPTSPTGTTHSTASNPTGISPLSPTTLARAANLYPRRFGGRGGGRRLDYWEAVRCGRESNNSSRKTFLSAEEAGISFISIISCRLMCKLCTVHVVFISFF